MKKVIEKTIFIRNKETVIMDNLPILNILWLDDKREPNKYFAKKSNSGAWKRNNDFYKTNIFGKYIPNYTWVKNIDEFKNYIISNGLPDFVSFDHDLTVDKTNPLANGTDCARWLVSYCKKNKLKLPRCFVHSANTKRIPEVEGVLGLTESQLKQFITNTIRRILLE